MRKTQLSNFHKLSASAACTCCDKSLGWTLALILTGMQFVFGYGSLIWKPPPHTISRKPGFVRGFARRFAQSSHDHRGTPEAPGVVVTLIPAHEWHQYAEQPDDDMVGRSTDETLRPFYLISQLCTRKVWGVVYEIDLHYARDVQEYLDEREQDGYTLTSVDVWNMKSPASDETLLVQKGASLYVGHSDNSSFIGATVMDDLAERIWKSVGPSGRNVDYLFQLSQAVKELAPHSKDRYLETLEAKVREFQDKEDNLYSNGSALHQ